MPIATCPRGCGWRRITPTAAVARRLKAEHVAEVHARHVDADIPEGRVQVRLDDTWITTTTARARDLHDDLHLHRW